MKINITDQDGLVCVAESNYIHILLTIIRGITGSYYSEYDGLVNMIAIEKNGSLKFDKYTVSVIEKNGKNTSIQILAYIILFISGIMAGMAIAAVMV